MATRIISETDGIVFVTHEGLIAIHEDRFNCEICDAPMNRHEWVLMGPGGQIIGICSISVKKILRKEKG